MTKLDIVNQIVAELMYEDEKLEYIDALYIAEIIYVQKYKEKLDGV